MARPLRIEYPGAFYHVMNRGLCRREVFHAEEFAQLFYDLLEEAHDRYQVEVHSFCLMGNHYHLCLRTRVANLGKVMQYINSQFTKKYNYIVQGDGPLFKGRYHAIIVQAKKYFLNLSRYIHLNPVLAGIVKNPEDYAWSSYPFYRGEKIKPKWLYLNKVLEHFNPHQALAEYAQFVAEGVDNETKSFFNKKIKIPILGDEAFTKRIKEATQETIETEIPETTHLAHYPLVDIQTIISTVSSHYGVNENYIQTTIASRAYNHQPRKIAIYLAVQLSGKSHASIGIFFNNLSYHGVSKAYLSIQSKIKQDKQLAQDTSEPAKLTYFRSVLFPIAAPTTPPAAAPKPAPNAPPCEPPITAPVTPPIAAPVASFLDIPAQPPSKDDTSVIATIL